MTENETRTPMSSLERYKCRDRSILVDQVVPLLERRNARFNIIDGGAGRADLNTFWRALPPSLVTLYGFDPEPNECERLQELARKENLDHRFFPVALWSCPGQRFLHIGKTDASLYAPNEALLSRFRYTSGGNLGEEMKVQRSVPVTCTTLDDWSVENGIQDIDFIKLNIQASELEVLKGSHRILPDVLGLQLEASFIHTYEGQPLFSDVDQFVRREGFMFFDFLAPNIVGRMHSPLVLEGVGRQVSIFRWPSRQIFEGHFLWFRDPISVPRRTDDSKILKLACLAELYGQVEYAFELLVWLQSCMQQMGREAESNELVRVIRTARDNYCTLATSK